MIRSLVLAALCALATALNCQASINTIIVKGTILDADELVAGTIDPGDAFTVTYSFDTSVAARASSNSNFSVFDALTAYSVTAGSFTATSTGAPEIQVDNNPGGGFFDRYGVVARASDGLMGPAIGDSEIVSALFRLDDSSNSVFTDALLLPGSLDLSSFTSSGFFMFFDNLDDPVYGTIDSIENVGTVVPEPATIAVWLGLAGVVVGCRRWNRRAA